MDTELQHTPIERPVADETRTIQISLEAWKKAKIHAVRFNSTLKSVVEQSIEIYTKEPTNAA
jgi:hypothetical protein